MKISFRAKYNLVFDTSDPEKAGKKRAETKIFLEEYARNMCLLPSKEAPLKEGVKRAIGWLAGKKPREQEAFPPQFSIYERPLYDGDKLFGLTVLSGKDAISMAEREKMVTDVKAVVVAPYDRDINLNEVERRYYEPYHNPTRNRFGRDTVRMLDKDTKTIELPVEGEIKNQIKPKIFSQEKKIRLVHRCYNC